MTERNSPNENSIIFDPGSPGQKVDFFLKGWRPSQLGPAIGAERKLRIKNKDF